MRRGFVFLLGLATLATGIWLIVREHATDAVCNTPQPIGSTLGTPPSCQNVAFVYFAGFVVAGAGVIVLLITWVMRRHELRYRGPSDARTDVTLRLDEIHHAEAARREDDA
jgi:hypothetical protein